MKTEEDLNYGNGCNVLTRLFYYFIGRDVRFRHCCDEHDAAYAEGGSVEDRRQADERFKSCIESYGHPIAASWCYLAVRMVGWKFFNYKKAGKICQK